MDIEGIERATLAAVPPRRLDHWQAWLLALDDGTVGRCHSAVPLQHAPPQPGTLQQIAARYAHAGLAPVFRVPEQPAFDAFRDALRAAGFARSKPTSVQTGDLAALRTSGDARVQLADSAPSEWEQVFLGEGFDAVDGASRLAILRRGRDSVFASLREQGRVVAVGSACLHAGWCGIHGMRTLPAFRGQGCASAILAALAEAARQRGLRRWFLQVEEGNAPARSLYARWGFTPAWSYAYWRRG